MQNTLPVKHYHIVFTVPHQLNAVCLNNQRIILQPVVCFGMVYAPLIRRSHYGGESGAVAVLCIRGARIEFAPTHPLHCPGRWLYLDGQWKNIGHSAGTFTRFTNSAEPLKESFSTAWNGLTETKRTVAVLRQGSTGHKTKWVYTATSLAGAEHYKYLGQYTHRVAINQPAHPEYCRRKSHVHRQRLPRYGR